MSQQPPPGNQPPYQQPYYQPPYQQPPPPRPPSNAFERLMLTITGMSALAILFILVFPLILCIGIGAFCLLLGVGAGLDSSATVTPFR